MKTNSTKRNLGRVHIADDVFSDDLIRHKIKRLLSQVDDQPSHSQIVHTKVLIPGDFQNLISQYKVFGRITSGLDVSEVPSKHVYCNQLGRNLCWRCSRKTVERKLKDEIHKVMPTADPNILPRLICVQNALKNMKLPSYSTSEISKWKTDKSEYREMLYETEPLFFPYPNVSIELVSTQSSDVHRYETNAKRQITFADDVVDEEVPKHLAPRSSIHLISPVIIQSNDD